MLTVRPWKLDAIIRLVLSVFLCFIAGYLVTVALPVISAGHPPLKLIILVILGLISLGAGLLLIRRPWPAREKAGVRLALIMTCTYAGLFLALWAQQTIGKSKPNFSTAQMLVALVSFQGALLAFIPGFLRDHQITALEAFGFKNRLALALAGGLIAASTFYQVSGLIQVATGWLMQNFPIFPIHPEEQTAVHTIRLATSWFDRFALAVGAIVLAPLAEEVLFRGILYPWIKAFGYPQLAFWGTSLLFACVHFNLLSLPALFILAVLLTFLYEVTGNLLAPITAHIAFNTMNLVALYRVDTLIHQQPY